MTTISLADARRVIEAGLPAADLAENAQPDGQSHGVDQSDHGRVMIFAGGVPLRGGDEIVGAVGLSGGSGDQGRSTAEVAAAAS